MPVRTALIAGLAALALPAAAQAAPSASALHLQSSGARALLTDCPVAVRLRAGTPRAVRDGVTLTARTLASGDRRYAFALLPDLQYCGLDVQRGGRDTRPRAKQSSARSGTYTDLRAGRPGQASAVVVFARPRALPDLSGEPRTAATAQPFTGDVPDVALRAACPFVETLDLAPEQPTRRTSLVGVATVTSTPTANRFAFAASEEGELCGAAAVTATDDATSVFFPALGSDGVLDVPPIALDAFGRTSGVQRVSFYARRVYDARP